MFVLSSYKSLLFFTFFVLSRAWLFLSDVGDLEDVADVSVRRVALGPLLQLVHLFHLQMLNSSDVVHQSHLAAAGKLAERAIIRQP